MEEERTYEKFLFFQIFSSSRARIYRENWIQVGVCEDKEARFYELREESFVFVFSWEVAVQLEKTESNRVYEGDPNFISVSCRLINPLRSSYFH